jgi:cation diffusion facilitator family transporter
MTVTPKAQAEKEKHSAALSSVLAAVFLTMLKLIVGLLTGSLGILAEAAHSGLDLVAALVTMFAVRFSDHPPDEQHLYGHGKIENLSALVETLLLLITCVWIIYEAIQRLFFETIEIEAGIWAFAVMAISIVVDVSRSQLLYRIARKHNSQALEADALHFSTDIWSSAVVIVGLFLVWLSQQLGASWAWLASADAVAALVVALIVVYVSLQLGRRAVAVLLDAAPPGLAERIATEASQVMGVQAIRAVRVRQAGPLTFADLTIAVERNASLERGHQIATAVERQIGELIGRGDVVVHVDPERHANETLPQTVSLIARRLGLRAHHIHTHKVRGHTFVDLHVEVPRDLTLAQAHKQVSQLETAIRDELPHVGEVNTHIELQDIPQESISSTESAPDEHLQTKIMAIMATVPEVHGCHNIHVHPISNGYDVTLHCLADPDLPMAKAHHLAKQVEQVLLGQVPSISQVLVHIEPEDVEHE